MKQAVVYRIYNADDELIYIGVTIDLERRMYGHRRQSRWHSHIARVESESYPDRDTAWAAEREAIRAERPKFNVIDNPTATVRCTCTCYCHVVKTTCRAYRTCCAEVAA